jgi:UDP-3-O-[3-hydroxymyristoyl] glucosamine N-acyltransferase
MSERATQGREPARLGGLHVLLLRDVARELGLAFEGDGDLPLDGLASLEDAGERDLSFVTGPRYRRAFHGSRAGAVLVPADFDAEGRACLRCAAPYVEFARAIELFQPRARPAPGVHPSAVVAPDAVLGRDVFVGPFAVIGRRVRIGDRTRIHAHVTLYDGARVGEDCEIHSGAALREDVELGDRVVVQNGSVIGSEGFGFAYTPEGRRVRVPHRGGVGIGDDTQIGANTTIDASHAGHPRRGEARARTRLGRGVAIDNLVQVGHGCAVGDGTTLCAHVALGGSTELGRGVTLAGAVKSAGHLKVGDGAVAAGATALLGDVAPRARVAGIPHMELGVWRRAMVALRELPALLQRVRRLEQRLGAGPED